MELPILTWTHSSCLMTIALEGSTVAMAMVMQISDIALVPSPPSPLFFSHLFVLALFSKRLLQLFFPLSPLCLWELEDSSHLLDSQAPISPSDLTHRASLSPVPVASVSGNPQQPQVNLPLAFPDSAASGPQLPPKHMLSV